MVRPIKRANADDRGKLCRKRILSQPPIWSQRQLNSHAREELEKKSILLRSVGRGIWLTLSHGTQIMTQSPGGYTSSRDFLAHGTSDRCPGCRALISGRAQGHRRMSNSR